MEPTTTARFSSRRIASRSVCHSCQTPIRWGAEGFTSDLCPACFMEAGLENEHEDGGHTDQPNAECSTCGGSVDRTAPAPKPASVDTGRTNLSHTYPKDCTTPAQRKAHRAAIRKEAAKASVAAPAPAPAVADAHDSGQHKSTPNPFCAKCARTVSFTLNEIEHATDLENAIEELAKHITFTVVSVEPDYDVENAHITIRTTATKAELAAARENVA